MTLTTRTLPSHIVFDEQGRAWLDGTGRKVVEIAIDNRAGLSAAQIHAAHPDLPLAKIHAALAYYYDHQAEFDSDIERLDRYVEQVQSRHPNRVTRQELEDRRTTLMVTRYSDSDPAVVPSIAFPHSGHRPLLARRS